MMTEQEVKKVAERVFRRELKKYGFSRVDVSVDIDEEGEEFFDIESHLAVCKVPLDPRASIRAISHLHDELLRRGEKRFPNVVHLIGH